MHTQEQRLAVTADASPAVMPILVSSYAMWMHQDHDSKANAFTTLSPVSTALISPTPSPLMPTQISQPRTPLKVKMDGPRVPIRQLIYSPCPLFFINASSPPNCSNFSSAAFFVLGLVLGLEMVAWSYS